MNDQVYVDLDFSLPGNLPKPGVRDLAETFGVSADVMDKDRDVRSVEGQPGTWRAGVKSDRAGQVIDKGHGQIKSAGSDFYLH